MRLNESTFFACHALFSRPRWPIVTVTENWQTHRTFRETVVYGRQSLQTISQLSGPFTCYRHQASTYHLDKLRLTLQPSNAADAYCDPARPNLSMQVSDASIFLFPSQSLFPYLISDI